jgi:glycosyltransferase involved in cell wall biosynthesis
MFYPHTKILFHPDGVEWKRSKWNPPTKWFLRLSIEAACRNAHKIILDNEALMNEMYAEYKSKIVFISYGGDQHLKNLGHESSAPYWLTVARAEPENNLDEVAECFASLPAEKWVLLSNISDTRYGRKLKTKFKDFPAIVFAGKTYDSRAMAHLYASARGIIHPHGSGGTNPSLVEAMWSKKVLICHDNVFNRATTHNLCYFFKSAEDLKKLVTGPDLIQKDSLSELANTSYSWKIISEHYARLFNSV